MTLAGCGGGSATYAKAAYVDCLNNAGVPTQDFDHPVTASDYAVAKALRPIAPNMIVAKFANGVGANGEFLGVAFGKDSRDASRILKAFEKLAKQPGATAGKIEKKGNIVYLMDPHITVGMQKTLTACETDATIK